MICVQKGKWNLVSGCCLNALCTDAWKKDFVFEKKPFKDTQCADCVNSSLLVDALIVTKVRGIQRRNTENALNFVCPLPKKEQDKCPSAQNDPGIYRILEWDENNTLQELLSKSRCRLE